MAIIMLAPLHSVPTDRGHVEAKDARWSAQEWWPTPKPDEPEEPVPHPRPAPPPPPPPKPHPKPDPDPE